MSLRRCSIPRCRQETAITYLDYGICESHWDRLSREDLRHLLRITKKLMEGTNANNRPSGS